MSNIVPCPVELLSYLVRWNYDLKRKAYIVAVFGDCIKFAVEFPNEPYKDRVLGSGYKTVYAYRFANDERREAIYQSIVDYYLNPVPEAAKLLLNILAKTLE